LLRGAPFGCGRWLLRGAPFGRGRWLLRGAPFGRGRWLLRGAPFGCGRWLLRGAPFGRGRWLLRGSFDLARLLLRGSLDLGRRLRLRSRLVERHSVHRALLRLLCLLLRSSPPIEYFVRRGLDPSIHLRGIKPLRQSLALI
jgi:hypothetical protein